MRITWHGHSCCELRNTMGVVIDPHDGKSIGIKPPVVKADIVLVTHEHFDHNCVRIVKGDPVVVREPGEHTPKGLRIIGLPTFHDHESGTKRGRNIIYTFVFDGIRICHCGDLGHMITNEQIRTIGPVDVLFVPVGGTFTLDLAEVRELISTLNPSIVVPMHYRWGSLSISVQTIEPFLEDIPEEQVLGVGNEVELIKEELPPVTEYWVFSP